MKERLAATVVLWGLVILLPMFLGDWGAFILIWLFAMGSYLELHTLLGKIGLHGDRMTGAVGLGVLLLAVMVFPPAVMPPMVAAALVLAGILAACLLKGGVGQFAKTMLPTLGGVFVLGLPMATMVATTHEHGLLLAIWFVAVAKFGDAGALIIGMFFGKHRMAPAYSPKKTWEGLGGGILGSVVASLGYVAAFSEYLPTGLTLYHAAWTAVIICIAGVLSDLMESAIKREAGVKDSGKAIPGIGGFLDLSDSMILVLPTGYFLMWLIL